VTQMELVTNESVKPYIKFWFVAGLVIRGQIKRRVIEMCLEHGLSYEVVEDKGLLESMYIFTVRGPQNMLVNFNTELRSLIKWIEDQQ